MNKRIESLKREIELKQEVLSLETRIDLIERDLCKSKTPIEIFGREEWFKVDQIGSRAFNEACEMIRNKDSKIIDLRYDIQIRDQLIKIFVTEPKISKVAKKSIKKIIEERELPFTIWGEE